MKRHFLFSFASLAMIAMLAAFSACCKSDTIPDEVDDNTDYRPTTDQMDVTIPFSSYISEGEFQGSTKYIVDRLKTKKPTCDQVMLIILNTPSIEKLSDEGYSLLTGAMAEGAMLLIDCPTTAILEKVTSKIYDSTIEQVTNGAFADTQVENLKKVLCYLEDLCENSKKTGAASNLDFVAVSSYSTYSALEDYDCNVSSDEIDENGDVLTKSGDVTGNSFNDYDYGKMADRFASTFNSECAIQMSSGDTGHDPHTMVSHVLLPVVYDLRKVSYEREGSQIVPAMNMELTRTVLPVYTPADKRDHYIVNQVLLAPFKIQGVQRGKKWWQIGRRHYGPYMTRLEMNNSLTVNGTTPAGLWINNAKPTNSYAMKTYSETTTLGVTGGFTIAEKPAVNLGFNFSDGTTVAQTCPVVKTEDLTSGITPSWAYTLNQKRPVVNRELNYSVNHDELDETVFQNHTFAQSWEWVFPSGLEYAGAAVKDLLHVKLVQEDLGWSWTDGTHLKTRDRYNSMTFEFDCPLEMPCLERSIQRWDIYLEDCADAKTQDAVRDILKNHVTNYFDQTFNLSTLTDDDTKRIDLVIAETCGSIDRIHRTFVNAGVKTFTLRWQRADSDRTYKEVSFKF